MSHATDACNLAERGVPGTGLGPCPAASLHGRITLALHLDGVVSWAARGCDRRRWVRARSGR